LRSLFSTGSSATGEGSNPAPDASIRPPGAIPNAPAPAQPEPTQPPLAPPGSPSGQPQAPATNAAPAAPAAPTARPAAAPSMVPPSFGGIAVSARFGREAGPITGGLQWRVYSDRPDTTGQFRMIKEERVANPTFMLPPGGYIVHVAMGLASAAKRVQVRADTIREVFELPVGALRIEGKVGEGRIPTGQITFDVYKGSQFEGGTNRALASDIPPGDLVIVPEGSYHVVSNYGDGNAVMRYDVAVQAGKVTEAVISHRAAAITLKLVSEAGGEALANTAWSVLTPGGDVIKESIGAFPRVVLAEGEYVAIARSDGKVYNREFKVEAGSDREIELVAR
jgi:hypothetical protein